MVAAKPVIFLAVLDDSQRWAVEVELPDGTVEQIDAFKHHFEAADWISNHSNRWLQERGLTD
jgi:hypothetical protein